MTQKTWILIDGADDSHFRIVRPGIILGPCRKCWVAIWLVPMPAWLTTLRLFALRKHFSTAKIRHSFHLFVHFFRGGAFWDF